MDHKLGDIDDLRLVSAAAHGIALQSYEALRQEQPPRQPDLDYLNSLHQRLYGEVYPWAGQLRQDDNVRTADHRELNVLDDGGPRHGVLAAHMQALDMQRQRDESLFDTRSSLMRWADFAGYQVAELFNARPYQDGNELTARLFTEQLAKVAGHPRFDLRKPDLELGRDAFDQALDAAKHGAYDPMREVLECASSRRVRDTVPKGRLDAIDANLRRELTAMASPQVRERLGGDAGLARLDAEIRQARKQLPSDYEYNWRRDVEVLDRNHRNLEDWARNGGRPPPRREPRPGDARG